MAESLAKNENGLFQVWLKELKSSNGYAMVKLRLKSLSITGSGEQRSTISKNVKIRSNITFRIWIRLMELPKNGRQ